MESLTVKCKVGKGNFQKFGFRIAALLRKRPGRGIIGRGGAVSLRNSAGILYHACPEKASTLKNLKSLEDSRLFKCRRPESNRYGRLVPQDFKSCASASSATAAFLMMFSHHKWDL